LIITINSNNYSFQ